MWGLTKGGKEEVREMMARMTSDLHVKGLLCYVRKDWRGLDWMLVNELRKLELIRMSSYESLDYYGGDEMGKSSYIEIFRRPN